MSARTDPTVALALASACNVSTGPAMKGDDGQTAKTEPQSPADGEDEQSKSDMETRSATALATPHMDIATPSRLAKQGPQHNQEWREYVSGGGATFLAIMATFPINKAMFRQQVHNISPREAVRQLLHEGAFNMYRGIMSPLLMKISAQSVMFGSYAQYSRLLQESARPPLTTLQCKLAGAVLAGASEAALMPLERAQVLMQDAKYNKRFKNTLHAMWSIKEHGPTEYYRGMSAILLRNCLGNMIFFTQRERIKTALPEEWKKSGSYSPHIADFVGGACLGAFISTLFYPVNVAKAHMQIKIGGSFERLTSVFLGLLKERGWRGIFRGVHTNYTRSFLSWGIINVAYENILHYLRETC